MRAWSMGALLVCACVCVGGGRYPPEVVQEALARHGRGRGGAAGRAVTVRQLYVPGYKRAHPTLCRDRGEDTLILILVMSTPSALEQRRIVRRTYKRLVELSDSLALAFVIGSVADEDELRALAEEDKKHNDVIMLKLPESPRNVPLKVLAALEWMTTFCPLAQFVLKANDDVFLNVLGLVAFATARRDASNTLWGRAVEGRGARGGVGEEPPHLAGAAYLLTGDAVAGIVRAATRLKYHPYEEVLVTGQAAAAVRAGRRGEDRWARTRCDDHGLTAQLTVPLPCVRDRLPALHALHDQLTSGRFVVYKFPGSID